MNTRLLNRCKRCGNTWLPNGFDFSKECPRCRSEDVDFTGVGYLLVLALIAAGAAYFWMSDRPGKTTPGAVVRPASTPATPRVRHTPQPTVVAVAVATTPIRIITEADGRREALRLFPELGVPNSPLNREFMNRYRSYQRLQPEFFRNPAWAVVLVKQSATVLAGQGKTP